MTKSGMDPKMFAAQVGVTKQAVLFWIEGVRKPRPEALARIVAATNGTVTADDFYLSASAPTEAAE